MNRWQVCLGVHLDSLSWFSSKHVSIWLWTLVKVHIFSLVRQLKYMRELCNSWPCVQMPMYLVLKFGQWGHVILHNLESLCVSKLDKYRNFFLAKVSLLQARVITFANHQQLLELLEIDFWWFFFPVISYFKSYCLHLCICVGWRLHLNGVFSNYELMLVSVNIISSRPCY